MLWPRRRPRAPRPGPAPRSPPVPSGPSGALHTSGACLLVAGSARFPPWPCRRPPAPQPGPAAPPAASNRAALCRCAWLARSPPSNFACNSPTTLSNYEFVVLEFQRFQTLLKLHPIELHATFAGAPLPPPTGTAARPCVSNSARTLRTPGALRIGVRLSTISHVIPVRMFQDLNCDRWYFNVSECC